MQETKSIDEMSDEEIASYIQLNYNKRTAMPSEHQQKGGAPLPYSLLVLVLSVIGMGASLELLLSERSLLINPDTSLSCDINPLVGCSDFLLSEYNTAFFSIPNSLWGLMFFSGMTALALAWIAKARLSTWFWRLICLAMVGASGWLAWFWYISFFVKESMCPFCVITWTATIPLIIHTWIRASQGGHLPCTPRLRGILVRYRWLFVFVAYLCVVALAYATFGNKLAYIF